MCVVRHAEVTKTVERPALVEQPQDDLLSPDRACGGDADVEVTTVDRHRDLAVLGPATLDDVHAGGDLQPRGDRRTHRVGQRHHVVQRAVDAVAHTHALVLRLDVYV